MIENGQRGWQEGVGAGWGLGQWGVRVVEGG